LAAFRGVFDGADFAAFFDDDRRRDEVPAGRTFLPPDGKAIATKFSPTVLIE